MLLIKCKECGADISELAESCPRSGLRKTLGEVWHDLQADAKWKYEQLTPMQLLKKSELRIHLPESGELIRATWFWSRRPRLLSVASSILWITVTLGLPFWLFRIPSIGVPLIVVTAIVINTDLVRSLRWRRQYESSIDRLIRTIAANDSGGPSRSNPLDQNGPPVHFHRNPTGRG